MNGRRRRGMVLFPLPLQGHINPMIELATLLHKEGFTISIIHTKFNSIDHTKYPCFTFHAISDGLSSDGGCGNTADTSDIVVFLKNLNLNCAGPFEECFKKLVTESEDEVVCLITDTTWYVTQDVADNLKVPRISFRTTSVCSFLAFDALSLFHQKGYLLNKDVETELSEFPPLKVKDFPVIKTQEPQTLYHSINHILEITKKSSALIFNTFKEIEENEIAKTTQKFHAKTFAIGPLHKYNPTSSSSSSLLHQDRSAISWLNKQSPKSVLYISFGSLAVMTETELCEVALGLANSMQKFLWVIRPGSVGNEKEMFPNGFLKNVVEKRGFIVKWAPQVEVLGHSAIGGFWTHSGWNSTLESICEGVPMICSPFFGDQMVNSRYVSDVWRIGVRLEKGFRREEIEDAIRKVMVDEQGEEMKKRVMILKEKSQLCVRRDEGSSYESLKGFIDYVLSL